MNKKQVLKIIKEKEEKEFRQYSLFFIFALICVFGVYYLGFKFVVGLLFLPFMLFAWVNLELL